MTINILAFGIAKDILGGSTLAVELADNTTVSYLKEYLEQAYPRLKKLATFMIAVNNEYASDDLIIKTSDEIAIIPPVSGG